MCLMGKAFCSKLVNQDAFKTTILRAWKTLRIKAVVEIISDNKFIFEFTNGIEKWGRGFS